MTVSPLRRASWIRPSTGPPATRAGACRCSPATSWPPRIRWRRRPGCAFRDTAVPGRYIEYFLDESWVEHLRRLERFTASDAGLRERRLAFHLGEQIPKVQRYIGEALVG